MGHDSLGATTNIAVFQAVVATKKWQLHGKGLGKMGVPICGVVHYSGGEKYRRFDICYEYKLQPGAIRMISVESSPDGWQYCHWRKKPGGAPSRNGILPGTGGVATIVGPTYDNVNYHAWGTTFMPPGRGRVSWQLYYLDSDPTYVLSVDSGQQVLVGERVQPKLAEFQLLEYQVEY